MFLIGGTMLIGEQVSNYDLEIDEGLFENVTIQAKNISDTAIAQKDELKDNEVMTGSAWDGAIAGALNIISNFWNYIKSSRGIYRT